MIYRERVTIKASQFIPELVGTSLFRFVDRVFDEGWHVIQGYKLREGELKLFIEGHSPIVSQGDWDLELLVPVEVARLINGNLGRVYVMTFRDLMERSWTTVHTTYEAAERKAEETAKEVGLWDQFEADEIEWGISFLPIDEDGES